MATPVDETRSRRAPRSRSDARGAQSVLVRVLAAGQPLAGAARHSLAGLDEVRFGRGSGISRQVEQGLRVLDLRVPDPFASRHHARMVRAGDRWVLEDASSKNGLRVNGGMQVRRWLEDGDLFEVGETFFVFRSALVIPEAEPPDIAVTPSSGPAPGMATVLPDLVQAFADLARVARSPLPILLRGETGTGKEVLARAYHQLSGRSGPLVAVNCGAIPPSLLESNLFGHLRGAFTGATEERRGLVASAHRGTLVLDEIAELPLASQSALLRVLHEREVLSLGATRPVPVDLRIVAASSCDLTERVRAGQFRDDLLARLQGHELDLPPLRARREDLGLMLTALWEQSSGDAGASHLSLEAAWALLSYEWPHNVRELEQTLVAARALASDVVELDDLPARVRASAVGRAEASTGAPSPRDEVRRAELRALLMSHAGNVSLIARELGTSRTQVHRLCDRFGLDAGAFRGPRQR